MQNSQDEGNIRIAIIDGHALFVEALSALFEKETGFTLIGHASDRLGALELARSRPDVILLEMCLDKENSLDFLPDLLRVADAASVVVVTGVTAEDSLVSAVKAGAAGIVLKTEPAGNLVKAIRKVHSGELWIRRSIMARAMRQVLHEDDPKPIDADEAKIATLTARELEVIAFLGQGLRNKQIGERLFISETTVRHHLTSIFNKLDVADRLELIIYAYQHGLAQVATIGSNPTYSAV